ncbi:RBBP9/YdeN family alpha/beta hydrolase [Aestuariivirga litoralis]|uniref:RBBP9/YdeN family alpha/beta hydrolase n=1 Tax=Aestuariivirga litoralis TaxID=2650924 RepID=UPI0018C743B6|nr:alpha/beta fold hydrolase [Aestuariivirga litoralis]MBG1231042.1 serine hydrolase family protein [Aestuariivirga litoralis]
MKSSETDILIIAGYEGSGPDHWQSRIVKKLPSARMVEQEDWLYGSLDVAVDTLVAAVAAATKPVVFVAHSAGCILIAHAMPKMREQGLVDRLKGGYLVAPPSEEAIAGLAGIDPKFKHVPRDPLPFPSLLIASSNDPFSTMEQSADLSAAWGSQLVEAGEQGHINAASGHGPWPEGLMRFAGFLSKLT